MSHHTRRHTATVASVHPIEWLRLVARSDDLPPGELAAEAAVALAGLGDDPRGLVPACRRLLERHPEAGPLWWSCARMLSTDDPAGESRQIQADLAAEQVGLSLALDVPEARTDDSYVAVGFVGWSPLVDELAERRPDLEIQLLDEGEELGDDVRVLLLDVLAAGSDTLLVQPGNRDAVASARRAGIDVWAAVGVGRRLPEALFQVMRRHVHALDEVGSGDVVRVVEPVRIGCPCPPELLHLPTPS